MVNRFIFRDFKELIFYCFYEVSDMEETFSIAEVILFNLLKRM